MLVGVMDSFYEKGLPDPAELELVPSLASSTLEAQYPLKVAHFESTKNRWSQLRNSSLDLQDILLRERAYILQNLNREG